MQDKTMLRVIPFLIIVVLVVYAVQVMTGEPEIKDDPFLQSSFKGKVLDMEYRVNRGSHYFIYIKTVSGQVISLNDQTLFEKVFIGCHVEKRKNEKDIRVLDKKPDLPEDSLPKSSL